MSKKTHRRARGSLALTYGRLGEDLSQGELSRRTGIPDVSALETKREPDRRLLERAFVAMDRVPEQVDVALFCADLLRRPEPFPRSPVEPTPEEARLIQAAAALEAVPVFEVTREQLTQVLREAKAAEARQEAEVLFRELMQRLPEERWRLVETSERYRTWALCERTALASEKLAAHDADQAVDLARLAVRMAELTPGDAAWRARVGGICWGLLGNARRVKGNFPLADEAFDRSDELWQAGAVADPGLILDGTRLLDLKASLRRHQGRPEESLSLLKQALAVSGSAEVTIRLLLKKAFTLKEMGSWQKAIAALDEARPLVESQGGLRDRCVLEFNLCSTLTDAGRHGEAEKLIPTVRRLAIEAGNGLDLLRCRWLQGRLEMAQGKLGEAVADLEAVAGELVTLAIAFDAAQACLDLAQVYLRQARPAEVKRLASQIVAVFRAQRVHREALAAVILFQEAAEQDRVTVELAQKLSSYLRRAQHQPSLRFELDGPDLAPAPGGLG